MQVMRLVMVLMCVIGLVPALAGAQDCTHYASPTGGGNGSSPEAPFRVNQFWPVAGPGMTLCLLNGTYNGGASMIEPPTTLHGAEGNPITVRALHEGKVLLDGQGSWAVRIRSNWWVIEGINARNGGEFLLMLSGQHNRGRRVIGWDGTNGQNDSNIFRVVGTDNMWEDVAGWGNNSRKIFDGAQAGNVGQGGFRRAWGEWNDWPSGESWPTLTYQIGYNTTNQLVENVIGTWHTTGQNSPRTEGIFRAFRARDPNVNYDAGGTRILGSIFYLPAEASYGTDVVFLTEYISNLTVEDTVAWTAKTGVMPFIFDEGCSGGCRGNVCKNCLSIHNGSPSINTGGSGFTLPNFRQGKGLAAATGGVSPFLLLPGICKRYVNGVLTNAPLWPWPMNDRIKEARVLSGRPPVDVTATITNILGPIPDACMKDDPTPPPPPPSPDPTLLLTQTSMSAGGSVTATWAQIPIPSTTDWLGLYRPEASNRDFLDWRYTTGEASGVLPFEITASRSPGMYEVRLLSNDGYTALATSLPLEITVPMATLTVVPTTVKRGDTLAVAWSGMSAPSPTDWIGLYTPTASNRSYLRWIYVSCSQNPGSAQVQGTCPFVIPSGLAPGMYQFRLLANDGYTSRATSTTVTVE